MCEFRVFLDDQLVMEDVIFAKLNDQSVELRDVIGETKTLNNVNILEVNVSSKKLLLKEI